MKTYQGSCHCGAVRFECDGDLGEGTSKCNCAACRKHRFWKMIVPDARFRLLAGAEALSEYRFGSRAIGHFFCGRCGVKVFGRTAMEPIGPFHAVNVACLDNAGDDELAAAPVEFQNGRDDRWQDAPAVTAYL